MQKAFDVLIKQEYIRKKRNFVAKCLNIKVTSQGKNLQEAIKNIKDAINVYLEENPQEKSKLYGFKFPFITRVFL